MHLASVAVVDASEPNVSVASRVALLTPLACVQDHKVAGEASALAAPAAAVAVVDASEPNVSVASRVALLMCIEAHALLMCIEAHTVVEEASSSAAAAAAVAVV